MKSFGTTAAGGGHLWDGSGILFKELYQCLAPDDVKNVMQLKFRYDDDRSSDVNFAYVREQHKVRPVSVDPRQPTMSSELLNEDFYGFWGYLHEHDWRLLGRASLLAPVGIFGEHQEAPAVAPRVLVAEESRVPHVGDEQFLDRVVAALRPGLFRIPSRLAVRDERDHA